MRDFQNFRIYLQIYFLCFGYLHTCSQDLRRLLYVQIIILFNCLENYNTYEKSAFGIKCMFYFSVYLLFKTFFFQLVTHKIRVEMYTGIRAVFINVVHF
jgi:hypothetical protein